MIQYRVEAVEPDLLTSDDDNGDGIQNMQTSSTDLSQTLFAEYNGCCFSYRTHAENKTAFAEGRTSFLEAHFVRNNYNTQPRHSVRLITILIDLKNNNNCKNVGQRFAENKV